LNPEQQQNPVNMASELLRVLSVHSAHHWHDLVTLDESWVCLRSQHDLMWTAPGEIVPTQNDTTFNHQNS
jgi:hypothetical protein